MLWGMRPPIGVRHFAVREGCYPPRPYSSHHTKAEFNNIVLLFTQNISKF